MQLPAMFRHRQQLRRWAARVLLMWLFGLGAGIANACLATAPATPGATSVGHTTGLLATHDDAASHEPARSDAHALPTHIDGAQGHQGNLAKANCQEFCDKATVSIPPLKPTLDDGQSHAVTVTAVPCALPAPAFAPVELWVPRRDGVPAPSIPIAFLRLAL